MPSVIMPRHPHGFLTMIPSGTVAGRCSPDSVSTTHRPHAAKYEKNAYSITAYIAIAEVAYTTNGEVDFHSSAQELH